MISPRTQAAQRELLAARTADALATYRTALADCDRTQAATLERMAFGSIDHALAERVLISTEARRQALREAMTWNEKRLARGLVA